MFRKTILLILNLLAGCSVGFAQHTVGEWTIYANFSETIDNIVETPSKVYYLSSNTLYSYDTQDSESYLYTNKKLNDTNISNIYYNKANKYLFIVYSDSNVDMLYENGKVVNFSDLMDTNVVSDKTINDVCFANNRVYIATAFGMIIYDDQRHEVVESGIYNVSVSNIGVIDNKVLLFADSKLYAADVNIRHNTIDKFDVISGIYLTDMFATADNKLIYVNSGNLYQSTIDFSAKKSSATNLNQTVSGDFKEWNGGFYFRNSSNQILLYNDSCELQSTIDLPESLTSDKVATWSGAKSVWFGNGDGIACYDISGSTPTVLNDRYRPEAFTCKYAVFSSVSADGKRFYFSNLGPSKYVSCTPISAGFTVAQCTNKLEDGKITDVSIKVASYRANGACVANQKANNNTKMYGGVTRMIEDPDIPNRYYIGNGAEGLYVVENDGDELIRFDETNSPIVQSWICRVHDVNLDPQGNLWVGTWFTRDNDATASPYVIIPADKRKGDLTQLQVSDWKASALPESQTGGRDMGSVFCKKSNMAFFWTGDYEAGVTALDTKGTYTNPNDDKSVHHSSFTDQDGASFVASRYICGIEDQKGRVWIGTTSGVFEITDPTTATSSSFTINRLKVPRNDGTNYADYLLESEQINSISVDASNRKWIATEVSGVYLVSEDGDELLEHFTTDNSYLPSNTVYSVICDPNSNVVYFGTAVGIVAYNGTSSPSSEDYSNVYAYPNPVRPDYTGWITVTGLMDNSLVKIADAAGNVFYQGRSEGGMVTWDGCNSAGERVKTGVYFVFASQSDDTKTLGCVTKILVIK